MTVTIVPGRQCGSCTLCCKVMAVAEIKKPQGQSCVHCTAGGCGIYNARPDDCRQFHCRFLIEASLKEVWRPSRSKIVLVASPDGNRIAAHVDPARPGAWKREPYYSKLKEWARKAVAYRGQVFVCIGKRTIVIFPDRDVDVGIVESDEVIVTEERKEPSGTRLNAIKMKLDDPRAAYLSTAAPGIAIPFS
jgi:hypothetical protein